MATQSRNGTGTELVHVGFGNFLAVNKVLAIVTPSSAPIQRMIREGKKEKTIIDITSGRRTKAAVFMDTGQIMLVAITPEALAGRVTAARQGKVAQAQAPSTSECRRRPCSSSSPDPPGRAKTPSSPRSVTPAAAATASRVNATTRDRRPNEQDGVDYYFVTERRVRAPVGDGDFLEHATVYGQKKGVLKAPGPQATGGRPRRHPAHRRPGRALHQVSRARTPSPSSSRRRHSKRWSSACAPAAATRRSRWPSACRQPATRSPRPMSSTTPSSTTTSTHCVAEIEAIIERERARPGRKPTVIALAPYALACYLLRYGATTTSGGRTASSTRSTRARSRTPTATASATCRASPAASTT